MAPENDVARPTVKDKQKQRHQPLKVVLKKKKRAPSSAKVKQQLQRRPRSSRGLPSFQPQLKADRRSIANGGKSNPGDESDGDDELLAQLACDTLLAVQSLHQSNSNSNNNNSKHQTVPSCLEIPVQDGGAPILGVLECQLHEFFTTRSTGTSTSAQKGGGSSSTVSQELDELLRNNTLRRLSNTLTTNQRAPITVYVFTQDYQRAARSSLLNTTLNTTLNTSCTNTDMDSAILEWFLRNLHHWTASRISHAALQQTWRQHPPPRPCNSCDAAIRWLQDRQLLHAATVDHTGYQLWLPQWGRRVLPAVLQARTDALAFLQQSQRGERSAVSVVQRLRRHPVPAHGLLVPWMVEQGWVQRVARPSGPALRFLGK